MKKKFNDPNAPCQLGNTRVLTELMDEEAFAGVKEMGFYACKENILLDLEYLHECGILMALHPEVCMFFYWVLCLD